MNVEKQSRVVPFARRRVEDEETKKKKKKKTARFAATHTQAQKEDE